MMGSKLAVALSLVAMAGVAAEVEFRRPEIVPVPAEMTYEANQPVRLNEGLEFRVACPDPAAAEWVEDHVKAWFGFSPKVSPVAVAGEGAKGNDGYALSVRPDHVAIGANLLQGVKYALMTLRQAAERESGGRTLKGYWLPAMEVKDAPALGFRGVHFCWFPELPASFIEHQIRLAAYYKFNYAVIESWGVFRSEKHPQLAIKDAPLTVREAKRLTAIAKDLGLTLIPQINIFGHATGARSMGGKHVTLDFHPEMQPLFEPAGGWNWCLSNPEARAAVREIVVELHEAFGNPPFFHIGCDEADAPSCPTCRAVKPYATLVGAHIAEVAALLRSRGARAMMWHDMLLERTDKRWKPFYANGDADTAKLIDTLPKDVVICDWYYGSDGGGSDPTGGKVVTGRYPTLDYFTEKGFSTLTCPWRVVKGIVSQGRYARERKMFGMLETVWHHFRGREFANMMQQAACAEWGDKLLETGEWTNPFATHWRQTGWDTGVKEYTETGYYDTTVTRDAIERN